MNRTPELVLIFDVEEAVVTRASPVPLSPPGRQRKVHMHEVTNKSSAKLSSDEKCPECDDVVLHTGGDEEVQSVRCSGCSRLHHRTCIIGAEVEEAETEVEEDDDTGDENEEEWWCKACEMSEGMNDAFVDDSELTERDKEEYQRERQKIRENKFEKFVRNPDRVYEQVTRCAPLPLFCLARSCALGVAVTRPPAAVCAHARW